MDFHLTVNGEAEGPYSMADLAERGLAPGTPVWHEGMTDWRPAAKVPELAELLARRETAPPPSPPPGTPSFAASQRVSPPTGIPGNGAIGPPALRGDLPVQGQFPPHGLAEIPVILMYLLTVMTLGLYPFFHFNMMHGGLPKVRPNDPSAGAAVGFHFIPLFNIYWVVFVHLRLVDRINEQRRLAGLAESSVRGFLITAIVFQFIPILNFAAPVLFLTYYGWLQASVNELVRSSRR
jgi:hypothetical protein